MIIITGASKGLGKSIAENLSQKGEEVIGLSRSPCSTNISFIKCDVGNYSSLKEVSKIIKKKAKPIKALINAAGIAAMNMALTTDEKTVEKIIQTNLIGTIFACQLFAPLMLRNKEVQ